MQFFFMSQPRPIEEEPPGIDGVVWNPDRVPEFYTLSESNRRFVQSGSTDYRRWLQTTKEMSVVSQGAALGFYWEIEVITTSVSINGYFGVVPRAFADKESAWNDATQPIDEGAVAYRGVGELWGPDNTRQVTGLSSFGAGDVVMLAFNPATGAFWTGVNGTWDRDPVTETARINAIGASFFASGQGRSGDDEARLLVEEASLNYAVPAGFLTMDAEPAVSSGAEVTAAQNFAVAGPQTTDAVVLRHSVFAIIEE